jgi:hypothetical protein
MNWRTGIAVVLLAVGVFGIPSMPRPSLPPAVSVVEPSQDMKNTVAEVVRVVNNMSIIDRLWLQYIYHNCAKVVAADGIVDQPAIVTTEGLRAVHRAVLKFIWRGMAENSPNKYAGLAKAIDDAVVAVIGNEQKPITDELRAEAVSVFDAISWAGLGKDE